MHAVNGLCVANKRTNEYLAKWQEKIEKNGPDEFFALHESIRREYAEDKEVIVTLADIVFSGKMTLDLGGVHVDIVESEAPHSDDSTLVYVREDEVLFLGDSTGDEFETGIKREDLCRKLESFIKMIGPKICVEGHWVPVDVEDTLKDLMES